MEKIKVGINGFGRIGRNVFRIICERPNLEIVGVNDLTSTKVLAHLLKYDSTQGKFPGTVEYDETALIVNGVRVPVTAERSPLNIKWGKTPASGAKPPMSWLSRPVCSARRKAAKAAMATT